MEEEENYERLIIKVKESFNNPELSDILVRAKDTTFYCHKLILSSREGGLGVEKSTNILHWPDVKDNIAQRILHWIYLGIRIASEWDSREFLTDLMAAAQTLKLTDVKTIVEDLIRKKDDIKLQVQSESKKQGMIKACNTCPGCLRDNCGICRMCQDMKKHGGEGKLKQRCRMRECSAQIQTRNLRKINKESLTKVPPSFMVLEKKNLFITKIVKIPSSNSFSVDPINMIIEEDLSKNEEKIDRVQDLTQEVNIVGKVGERKVTNKSTSNGQLDIGQQMSSSEKNISPDEVSHEVSTTDESLCSNAETSVREDKVCVTGEEDQDNVPVSVSNAGHDYTLISWVSKILDFSD